MCLSVNICVTQTRKQEFWSQSPKIFSIKDEGLNHKSPNPITLGGVKGRVRVVTAGGRIKQEVLWAHCPADAVFMAALFSLFCALGSEEGAVFPPVPWGVFAPGRVCLHGGHVALPLRLHHHVHRASQVRKGRHLISSTRTSRVVRM